MRQYLYIPLGGNRVKSKWRLLFNLWFVFLASGLWHGAAWGFIFWGAYHGFFLVVERLFLGRWLQRLGRVTFIYTFLVVMVGWVFFRMEYLHPSVHYVHNMFTWHPDPHRWYADQLYYTMLALAILFSFFTIPAIGRRIHHGIFYTDYSMPLHYVMTAAMLVLLILCAGRITTSTFNPFIYFRF